MAIIVGQKAEYFISNFIGKCINSPEQRAVQGFVALSIQPMIDYKNKKADNDTRAISVARTIGKIIAGTTAGVLIRYGAIKLAKNFSKYIITENGKYITEIKRKTAKDILLPKFSPDFYNNLIKEDFLQKHDNAIKAIGTGIACITMAFTNFFIDAPLTKKIAIKLKPIIKNYIEKQEKREANNAKQ